MISSHFSRLKRVVDARVRFRYEPPSFAAHMGRPSFLLGT